MNKKYVCLIFVGICVLLISLLIIIYNTNENINDNNKLNIKKRTIDDINMIYVTDNDYYIYEIPNFLSYNQCDNLINEFQNYTFTQSTVYNNKENVVNNTRNSYTTWLNNDNKFNNYITNKINKILKITPEYMEDLQVVYYPKGGYFVDHYDADLTNEKLASRKITFLIYLNDNYEGGGTEFPLLNYTVKPKKGKAVMFWTLDDNGLIIEKSLHRGQPITKGTKLICNKWIHNKQIN